MSPRYAPNHGTASRVPANTSAPIGEVSAHRQTPLDATNPPRLHCRANGSASIRISCVIRNMRYRFVLANTESEKAEITRYASGIDAGSGSPSTA
jgi:hypothetical protein